MTTIIGILAAFGLIISAILLDSSLMAFVNAQGILIVVLGTFAVTAISFRAEELIQFPLDIWRLLRRGGRDPALEAEKVLRLAVQARREVEFLKLERFLSEVEDTPFLHKSLNLLIDGSSVEEIENVLRREMSATAARHMRSVDFLRRAGEIAPNMGLIGTLVGLVKMLGNLDDPTTLGPAMAVALLTTFYGSVLANLIFIPLAAKAEYCASEESLVNNLYAMGAASMRKAENPRRLEMLLNTILPPAKRIAFFQ